MKRISGILSLRLTGLCLLVLLFTGCATIARYDGYAYAQIIAVRVTALQLMDSATTPYQQHTIAATQVMTDLEKMYEYDRNRPKNEISTRMVALIKDTSGHLFGGFVKRWQEKGTLDSTFIVESKGIIYKAFDQIAQLESKKINPSQVNNIP